MTTALLVRKADYMTPKQRKRALKSIQYFMEGNTWAQIHERGGYTWGIFQQMMVQFPDLAKSYSEARRVSAQSFEDKALALADKLAGPNEFTGTGVRAKEVAMNQYRWSASRRNPTEFAEAGAKQLSVVVPVQINSSLNLAQPGAVDEKVDPSVWEVHATVLERAAEAPRDGDLLPEPPEDPEDAEASVDHADEALEDLADAIGLPAEVPAVIKKRPSPGRPRKRHKDKSDTVLTAHRYAIKKKSPAVKRALGISEDEPNELSKRPSGAKRTGPARSGSTG